MSYSVSKEMVNTLNYKDKTLSDILQQTQQQLLNQTNTLGRKIRSQQDSGDRPLSSDLAEYCALRRACWFQWMQPDSEPNCPLEKPNPYD
jgi:hypothetical protein